MHIDGTVDRWPDLDRWRRDTPAALAGRIHLNNAGASLVPEPVERVVRDHLALEGRMGGYEAADSAAGRIERAYGEVAALIGAAPGNVAMVENATVAFAQALSALDPGPGDIILTTRNDYASNQLMYLSLAARRGVEVVRAADLPEGGVDPDSVRSLVGSRRPALVALSWVPTSSGLVQPAREVGEICAEAGVPYLVDACQAVGQLPVDVAALRCDFLAGTARKFLRGPRGAGFLYVSDRALQAGLAPLHIDMRGADWVAENAYELRADARRFENWEYAWALVLGLGEAARYAREEVGVETARDRARALAADLRSRLAAMDRVRVLDHGPELCAIVTVALDGIDPARAVAELRDQGINTSAVDRTSAVIDLDDKGAPAALRLSPHYFNTESEIRAAAWAIEGLLEA
jgi:selenocysteine lyase/cysteine desulfurase